MENLVSRAVRQASDCASSPTDVFETLKIVNGDDTQISVELTGCVFDQGANPAKRLVGWLERHE